MTVRIEILGGAHSVVRACPLGRGGSRAPATERVEPLDRRADHRSAREVER